MPTFEAVNDSVLAAGTSRQRQDPGHDRPPGRGGDREPGRLHGDQPEQQGQAGQPEQGGRQQPAGARPQQQRRPQQQQPPVDRVGDRAPPQPEQDQRDQAHQPQHPHPERGPGQLVHLHRHRHRGQLEPHEPQRVPQPQPPEGGMPQRLDVDRGPPQPPQGSHDPPRIEVGAPAQSSTVSRRVLDQSQPISQLSCNFGYLFVSAKYPTIERSWQSPVEPGRGDASMQALRLHRYNERPSVDEIEEPKVEGPLDVIVKIGGAGLVPHRHPSLPGPVARAGRRRAAALHPRPRERRLGPRGRLGGQPRRPRGHRHPPPPGDLRLLPLLPGRGRHALRQQLLPRPQHRRRHGHLPQDRGQGRGQDRPQAPAGRRGRPGRRRPDRLPRGPQGRAPALPGHRLRGHRGRRPRPHRHPGAGRASAPPP